VHALELTRKYVEGAGVERTRWVNAIGGVQGKDAYAMATRRLLQAAQEARAGGDPFPYVLGAVYYATHTPESDRPSHPDLKQDATDLFSEMMDELDRK